MVLVGDLLTIHNVLSENDHVTISVRSCVLVPKPNHVTKLVNDNSELVAVLSDADGLRTIPSLPYEGATPGSSSRTIKHRFTAKKNVG